MLSPPPMSKHGGGYITPIPPPPRIYALAGHPHEHTSDYHLRSQTPTSATRQLQLSINIPTLTPPPPWAPAREGTRPPPPRPTWEIVRKKLSLYVGPYIFVTFFLCGGLFVFILMWYTFSPCGDLFATFLSMYGAFLCLWFFLRLASTKISVGAHICPPPPL